MKLIICEKQMAAKRIADMLSNGKYAVDKKYNQQYYSFPEHYVVGLSGHVLKVDFPERYSSWSKVPLEELVNAKLIYNHDKESIIKLIKFLAKKSDEMIIATDYDTEGESIGLEAVTVINNSLKVKRMHFSALIKDEITHSYDNLNELNYNLAYSADARREIDLIWGAVLTRFLSVSTRRLGKSYLSAGRVQSPTLSLIVEKEKERINFKPEPYWEFKLSLQKAENDFIAYYKTKKLFDKKIKKELESINPKKALITKVTKKLVNTKPPIPLNTTTYLREAASLGYSGINAMRIAESLYLKGLTSYPRTDNQVYPKKLDVKKILKSFEKTKYGPLLKYLKKDLIPTKGPKETKDHPPIHPTGLKPEGLEPDELRIYDLIVKRFISTFSEDSVEELTKVNINCEGFEFKATGNRMIDYGWKGVYDFSLRKDNLLPELIEGDELIVKSIDCINKQTQPPNRYGHGTIIKAMSELGIGTKSTRPSIIQKLISRYYVFYSKSLEPTPIAMAVMNALDDYANIITEPSMTRELEKDMELIANGELTKEEVVNKSRELLLNALRLLTKNKANIVKSIREGIKSSRIVGKCPKCGKDMVIINARNRFVGCTGYPDCHNSYPLPQRGMIQVTNTICKDCGLKKILLIRQGKRPFVFCSNIDCPSREDDEETKKLRKSRDKYLAGLTVKDS